VTPSFNIERIDEIERETKHDVIAFLTHLAEIVGPEARFVHQGMTSSDVLDTCLNVQLTRSGGSVAFRISTKLLAALKKTRLRAQDDPDHRPLARHSRRTRDVRAQARLRLCRIQAAPRERLVLARQEVATLRDFRERSALSRRSIRAWKSMSPRRWGSGRSRSPPK